MTSIWYSQRSRPVVRSPRRITCRPTFNVSQPKYEGSTRFLTVLVVFPVFIRAQNDIEAELFQSQASTIVALTKGCKTAKVVRELSDVPPGSGSAVLSPTVVVYLLVRVSPHYDRRLS